MQEYIRIFFTFYAVEHIFLRKNMAFCVLRPFFARMGKASELNKTRLKRPKTGRLYIALIPHATFCIRMILSISVMYCAMERAYHAICVRIGATSYLRIAPYLVGWLLISYDV